MATFTRCQTISPTSTFKMINWEFKICLKGSILWLLYMSEQLHKKMLYSINQIFCFKHKCEKT
jgi:hypothetical protein